MILSFITKQKKQTNIATGEEGGRTSVMQLKIMIEVRVTVITLFNESFLFELSTCISISTKLIVNVHIRSNLSFILIVSFVKNYSFTVISYNENEHMIINQTITTTHLPNILTKGLQIARDVGNILFDPRSQINHRISVVQPI